MAAGDTQITIAGNLVDDPELRYTPTGQAVANFRVRFHAAVQRPADQRVEGRRLPVPVLQRLAAGGGERRREPAARHAGHRQRAAAAAVVRDQGRREAHGLRGRGRRGRPVAAQRLGQGHQVHRSGGGGGGGGGGGPGAAARAGEPGRLRRRVDRRPWRRATVGGRAVRRHSTAGLTDEPPFSAGPTPTD